MGKLKSLLIAIAILMIMTILTILSNSIYNIISEYIGISFAFTLYSIIVILLSWYTIHKFRNDD